MDDIRERYDDLMERPLFEVFHPDGHRWCVNANGKIDGFPEGVYIVNYARATIDALVGEILLLQRRVE